MSAETIFYIVGIALVVAALGLSALGVFAKNFPPSKGVLLAITVPFAVLVLATMAYAWMNAEDEQEHREHLIAEGELPSPAEGLQMQAEAANEATPEEQAEDDELAAEEEPGESQEGPEGTGADSGDTSTAGIDGAALYNELGCGGCHTLTAAGSTGTTGPDLDNELRDQSKEFIEQSIVEPNAEVQEGYPPNVMPQNYGEELTPEELQALVDYLAQSAKG